MGSRRQLIALLIQAGDFESARNVLTAGIAANPRDYQWYLDYVMVDLKSAGGIDAALATADRLQSQNRDFKGIKALKGDIYLAANRPSDAVAAYTEANNATPSSLLVTRLAGALVRVRPTRQLQHTADKLAGRSPGRHRRHGATRRDQNRRRRLERGIQISGSRYSRKSRTTRWP